MNSIYPFKFLDSYSAKDTGMFFGRDEEIDALYQMIFQSNILLVYGASGTGKTSLIQCGLASRFQPHDWLALYIRRGDNLNDSLDKAITAEGGVAGSADLEKSFKAIYRNSFRPVYLIFDQFEELFIIGKKDEQDEFIETVQAILNIEQPVKMIFSMREEYLGELYDFEKKVPQLLRNKLRVEPMNIGKVQQVVIGVTTFTGSNISLKPGEEKKIIDAIFDKVRGKENTLTIQLPYLQVFLDKLYMDTTHDDTRKANAVFSTGIINKMGDIGDVLRDFLEGQVKAISQKLSTQDAPVTIDTIWNILAPFVTLEGTKDPISMHTLLDKLRGTNEQFVRDTVKAFVDGRILRHTDEGDIYELAHDSLAAAVAGKRTDEQVALLEVERLVKSQVALNKDARELFTVKQVNIIDLYWGKLEPRLNAEDIAFVDESKEAIKEKIKADEEKALAEANAIEQAKKAKEQRRKKRIAFAFVLMILVMLSLSGLTAWSRRQTIKAESQALSGQAFTEIFKNDNITKAFKYAEYAFEKDTTNLNAYIALYNTVFQPFDEPELLFYKDINTYDYMDYRIGFSPDGGKVLCFNSDGSIKILDPVLNSDPVVFGDDSVKRLIKDNPDSRSVTYNFSPRGTMLEVACKMGNKEWICIDDTKRGNKVLNLKIDTNEVIYFAPEDKMILVPQYDGEFKKIGLFDPLKGSFTGAITLPPVTKTINAVVFSVDGKTLAIKSTSGSKNSLQIFSTGLWKELNEFTVGVNDSIYFSFSNDSRLLAVKCGNGSTGIFDLKSMNHTARTDSVSNNFSFGSKRLTIDRVSGKLIIWDFVKDKRTVIDKPEGYKCNFADAILSPDGQRILTRTGRCNEPGKKDEVYAYPLALWDANTREKIIEITSSETPQYFSQPSILLFSPDGRFFLNSVYEKNAILRDAATGKEIAQIGESSIFKKAVFSKDGQFIITASVDSFVKKWSLEGINDPTNLPNRFEKADPSDFSNEHGKLIEVFAARDGKDNTGKTFAYLGRDAKVATVNLPGERTFKASGKYIQISDSVSGERLYEYSIKDLTNCLLRINISPNNKYLLGTFGYNEKVGDTTIEHPMYSALWNIDQFKIVAYYDLTSSIFSPDSRFLLLFKPYNKRKTLLDVSSGTELAKIYFPKDSSVRSSGREYAFSKKSNMLMAKYKGDSDSVIVKAWLIDPAMIFEKMKKKIADLTPEEKEKFGIR